MPIQDVLIVIDMQNGVCKKEPLANLATLIKRITDRIVAYHAAGKPVIFIQHEDSELLFDTDSWQLIAELLPAATDYFIRKTHPNSFYKTQLQNLLQELSAQRLELCGAQTEYCVDATVKFAHGLGYSVTLFADGFSTVAGGFMTAETTNDFYREMWRDRYGIIL